MINKSLVRAEAYNKDSEPKIALFNLGTWMESQYLKETTIMLLVQAKTYYDIHQQCYDFWVYAHQELGNKRWIFTQVLCRNFG